MSYESQFQGLVTQKVGNEDGEGRKLDDYESWHRNPWIDREAAHSRSVQGQGSLDCTFHNRSCVHFGYFITDVELYSYNSWPTCIVVSVVRLFNPTHWNFLQEWHVWGKVGSSWRVPVECNSDETPQSLAYKAVHALSEKSLGVESCEVRNVSDLSDCVSLVCSNFRVSSLSLELKFHF